METVPTILTFLSIYAAVILAFHFGKHRGRREARQATYWHGYQEGCRDVGDSLKDLYRGGQDR